MSLSREDKDQLSGMLSAALHNPPPSPSMLDKLGAIDILRRWAWIILVGALMVGAEVDQRRRNTGRIDRLEKKMRVIRPLVLQHEWQVQQGFTNKDLKAMNIKAPDFPEDE